MRIGSSPRRWVAILALAALALGQASLALAACGMDRGEMAMAMPAGEPCEGCGNADADSLTALCAAHCTADLPLAASEPVFIFEAGYVPVLGPAQPRLGAGPPVALYLLPGMPPRRILLHSFQV